MTATPMTSTGQLDEQTSAKATALIERMPAQRATLLGILELCRQAQPVSLVNSSVDEMQRHNVSVYSAGSLTELLAQAGALALVTQDGDPYVKNASEPVVVETEDAAYLEVSKPDEAYWLTTPQGIEALEAAKPADALGELLADSECSAAYQNIMDYLGKSDGVSAAKITEAIGEQTDASGKRRATAYYLGRLERGGAIEWTGAWSVTPAGREAFNLGLRD